MARRGGSGDDNALRDGFYFALRVAGLEHKRQGDRPIRFHDLRHTFGTLAVQVFPVTDVKAYTDHADLSTTMLYVHHVPKHDAADRLTALLGETAGDGSLAPLRS